MNFLVVKMRAGVLGISAELNAVSPVAIFSIKWIMTHLILVQHSFRIIGS